MKAEVVMTEETYGVVLDALTSKHLRLEEQLSGRLARSAEKAIREEQLRVRLALQELLANTELRRNAIETMVSLSEHLGARVPECAGEREASFGPESIQ